MPQILGSNELYEDVIDKGLCVGCGACVNLCPYFKTYRGKTARIFPCTGSSGRCHEFCPKAEVDLDFLSNALHNTNYSKTPLGRYRQITAARAGKRMDIADCQTGGVVTALMTFALDAGYVDAAVLTGRDGLVPVPQIVTEASRVKDFSSSKYMASPTVAALNEGIGKGFTSLGIVGTPCQITSTALMRTASPDDDNRRNKTALTVGLFCTWALDTRELIALAAEKTDIPNIKSNIRSDIRSDIRSPIKGMKVTPPPSGKFIFTTSNGDIAIPLDEIRPLIPAGCDICPDMTSEWADISVGDIEGMPGWNTVIIRSEKGGEIYEKAVNAGYIEAAGYPDDILASLEKAASGKKKKAFSQLSKSGLLNPDDGKRAALRVNEAVADYFLQS